MSDPIHILSLGAGVQSSTLALMAAKGLVTPMPQCAIFADTQAEPPSVYRWLDWLEKQLPFPVHRVTAGSLTERITTTRVNRKTGERYYSNMIPAFTLNPDGTKGIVGRSCTSNFKIVPIMKKARQLGAIKRGQKTVGVVQWIGISLDEVSRMKDSRDPWAESRWPLIEMRMNRHDCFRWMEANGYPAPPPFRLQLLPVPFRCRMASVKDSGTGRVRQGRRGGKAVAGGSRFHHHAGKEGWHGLPAQLPPSTRPSGLLYRRGERPDQYVPKRLLGDVWRIAKLLNTMSKQRKTQKMSDKIERAIRNGWRRGLGPVGDWSRKSKKLTER